MDNCSKYFEDAETYLEAIEDYLGIPYPYDILRIVIAPESFPYGSMENPQLHFISPALIPANKNDLIGQIVLVHSMAHAWFGNMVTAAVWSSTWLNEGFATFIERQMVRRIFSPD